MKYLYTVSFEDCGKTIIGKVFRDVWGGRELKVIKFDGHDKEIIFSPKYGKKQEAQDIFNQYIKKPLVRDGLWGKYILSAEVFIARVVSYVVDGERYLTKVFFTTDGKQNTTTFNGWNKFECTDIKSLAKMKIEQTVIYTKAIYDGYGVVTAIEIVPNNLFPL